MLRVLALDFRETIGGEAKIQEYSHRLAREGGKKVAEILGTEMLDKDDQFTASMVSAITRITRIREASGAYILPSYNCVPSHANISFILQGGCGTSYPREHNPDSPKFNFDARV